MDNIIPNLITNYKPKKFGKEYVNINGSSQYPMFISTALGIKPSFDDWVDVKHYKKFVKMCKNYNLFVDPDVIFQKPKSNKNALIGGNTLTTTYAIGKKYNPKIKNGKVHVFISKSKKTLLEAKKFGWYPVATKSRCINKPFIDHLRFGKKLGFPSCCINFFKKYNNWNIYSHPFETFKKTPKNNQKITGSYLCNNFLMDNTFFLIHHLPCSYRCKKTMNYAKSVEENIKKVEPDFIKKTKQLLKKPLLVFSERNFIIFDGKLSNNSLKYTNYQYLTNPGRPEETIGFFNSIKNGNKIEFKYNKLLIKKNDKITSLITKKNTWFMINFE
ncbi:hypothetical protein HN415_01120 [Candidatus Woesearchaeota archaeon]|jgi:hypothetical protein|nr:hypothetical protein [Candidatus Woesearchaeota archaeon]